MPLILTWMVIQFLRAREAAQRAPAQPAKPGAKKVVHGQVVTPPATMDPKALLHLWLLFKGLG